MSALTVIRRDVGRRTLEQIIGWDISEHDAEELVDAGAAEPGPDYVLPPVLCLQRDLTIGGVFHPARSLLYVGGQITPGQALALLRGMHNGPDGAVVSVPRGGSG